MRTIVIFGLLASCGYRYGEPPDPFAPLSCPTAPASGPGVEVCADGAVTSRFQAADGVAVHVVVVTGGASTVAALQPDEKDDDGDDDTGGRPPPVTAVRVELDAPTALVLISPDGERAWVVEEVNPGTLTAVMLDDHGASLSAPSGVDRLRVEAPDDDPYDHDTAAPAPRAWGGVGTFAVLSAVRRDLRAGVTSFHVCDGCAALSLRPSETPNVVDPGPDCTTPEPPLQGPDVAPFAAACPSVVGQGTVCLVRDEAAWTLVGLDDGAACALPAAVEAPFYGAYDSIAWSGTSAFACRDRRLIRQDLLTGAVETSAAPCSGVASWKGGLLVAALGERQDLAWVSSFRDAQCGRVVDVAADFVDATLTVRRSTMYSAWHAGGLVRRTTLPGGARGEAVQLQLDGWVRGIASIVDDELLVLAEGAIRPFDLRSGARLGDGVPAEGFGLACVRRETDPATATSPR